MTRSKQLSLAKIDCPKHGVQEAYTLYEENEIKGIGCKECFEDLEVKEQTNTSSPLPNKKSHACRLSI